jgi:penicillin amidase
MKKRKWLKFIVLPVGILVILIVLIIAGFFLYLPRRSFPKTEGSVTLDGLEAQVEIIRDEYGVPHIYARSAADLFFAQGYVHAQDRFWQMELNRRIGAGRLSELFGDKTLDTDIYLRTMGLRRLAEEEYRLIDSETKRYLEAYSAGVNAYIRDKKPGRLGLEFVFLKLQGNTIEIEEWTPVDCLVWAKLMALSLSSNADEEPIPMRFIRSAGLMRMDGYFAPYRRDTPFIVNDDEIGQPPFAASPQDAMERPSHQEEQPLRVLSVRQAGSNLKAATTHTVGTDFQPEASGEFSMFLGNGSGIGSNSWVISGDMTATGKPILANDMHLGIQMPSIWYEIGLHTVNEKGEPTDSEPDDFQVRGFSMPGYPAVIAGHNSRIAWGYTIIYNDCQDIFFEKINPENPYQYRVNGDWEDMELVYERIDIQGEDEPYVLIVRKTHHGPIVSDLGGFSELMSYHFDGDKKFPKNLDVMELALQWTALRPTETTKGVFMLNRAWNYQEFREALRYWDAPGVNAVYADVEGNIGYQYAGTTPVRAQGDGQAPVPGWTGDYEWVGVLPYDELPWVLNPEKGYIVTANNPVVGQQYHHFLGSGFAYGYRARRIIEMITNNEQAISIEDVKTMQGDTLDLAALEVVPYLEGLDLMAEKVSEYLKKKEPVSEKERKEKEEKEREFQEALEPARQSLFEWDKRMDMESPQATLYSFFWLALVEETFKDQYPEALVYATSGRLQNALHYLLEDPQNAWWDDIRTPDVRETRDDILVRAFKKGFRTGRKRLGEEYESWMWGDIHQAEFENLTLGKSGIKTIEKIFNRGPVAASGGSTQINRASWDIDEPFKVNHLTTMRHIIDLGDLNASLMVHTPGQSGHPRHPHYDDMIEPWRFMEYHPNLWSRTDLESRKRDRLNLKPASKQ